MPKGGARTRSGPAPDPNALRRDRDKADWLTLPAAGRTGEPPEWPLSDVSGRELDLWRVEWARPQAVLWEANGQQLEVALFVRSVVDAESRQSTVAARTLVRQQMDSLLLTIPAMRAARVRIGDVVGQSEQPRRPSSPSSRSRFKVVEGGAESA